MTQPAACRTRRRLGPVAVVGVLTSIASLASLTACSGGGTVAHTTSNASKPPLSPSVSATYDPMSGPIEPASALPKSCSSILSDQDLTGALGSTQVGDTSYGNYAPLPKIGRTGRVTCGYGIPVDQSGNPGAPVVTVSVITYDQASRAISRVATDVNDTVTKGATAQPVVVDGHPATVLIEPASMSASAPAAAATSAAAGAGAGGGSTGSATLPSSPAADPPPGATAGSGGVTELLMADGNRTFVITIPLSTPSGTSAVNVLTNIAALVYRHTLPSGGSAAGSASAAASPTAS